MLDDQQYIKQHDPQDALAVAGGQASQLRQTYDQKAPRYGQISNIVVAGMGGSALPAVILPSWPTLPVPLEIVRGYSLPPYVGPSTLFISSSYSGNTEETLSALAEAEKRQAQIVVVAAGGKLAEIAKTKNYPLYAIPSGIQPRMSAFYFLAAFVEILASAKLIDEAKKEELKSTADWLEPLLKQWASDVPTKDSLAKQIAQELIGRTVIVYSGPLLWPAANKWKICFNENAKNLAWNNQYPEFNHNEFIGWSSHPTDKPFAVVEIRSNLEHERVQKRFEVSERLLSGMRPKPIVVQPQGETILQQLAWAIALGDHVSIYLALLNGVNPTPVDLVEKLKTELG